MMKLKRDLNTYLIKKLILMINNNTRNKELFPKEVPKLTPKQKLIKVDFMEHWLKIL